MFFASIIREMSGVVRLVFLLFFLISNKVIGQIVEVKGYLYNLETKETIDGAVLTSGEQIAKSNRNGSYTLFLQKGLNELIIVHPGFDTLNVSFSLTKSELRNFYLRKNPYHLKEIKIEAGRESSLSTNISPGAVTLSKKDLEKLPGFLGQSDPIKALQTLPGTGKGGEGNSGLYIRGGTSGQNLTLFNDVPIYNPSHLLGFFSVFNSESVEQVRLHKSAIPAEFGGRISSVIEVNSSKKIADSLAFKADVSMIAINSSLTLPVTKQWSFTTSVRKTFMNASVWPVLEKLNLGSSLFKQMRYDFFDINIISNARLSSKDYLYLFAYYGGDDFGFGLGRFNIHNKMNWHNKAMSASWKRFVRSNFVIQNTAGYSNYSFNFGFEQDKYKASIFSGIKDFSMKSVATVTMPRSSLKGGIQFNSRVFKPNTPFVNSAGTVLDFGEPNTYVSDETSGFLSCETSLSEHLGLYSGVRVSHYRHLGPYHINEEDGSVQSFKRGKEVSTFTFLEPSVSLRYKINATSSIKVAASANTQPVHLISVTAVNFPADFWMPSLNKLSPQKGFQASLGYFRYFKDRKFESYVELYYKKMTGLSEFSGGIMNLLDNLKIEDRLSIGTGQAYGAEFYVKRNVGKLTGWLGYTLSKSTRSFPGLNDGLTFPAKYDRRHDANIAAAYSLGRKWSLTASFTYATGNAYTQPTSRYLVGGNVVNEYGSFNGGRIPAYHRADVGAVLKFRSSNRWDRSLLFSIYNVYNRQNPIYVFFLAEGDLSKYQVSVQPRSVALLPVLPSVSYKMSLK